MTATRLIDAARTAGLTVEADGDRLVIRGPRAAGKLAQTLIARKTEVLAALAGATCCGQRATGTAGAPLVNACQLCPNSPTYWRDQAPSPMPVASPAPAPLALPDRSGGLVWSGHATGDALPCRICRRPAFMRDAEGRPCHKACAEQAAQHPQEVTR